MTTITIQRTPRRVYYCFSGVFSLCNCAPVRSPRLSTSLQRGRRCGKERDYGQIGRKGDEGEKVRKEEGRGEKRVADRGVGG